MTWGTYEIKNRLDGKAYGGSSGEIERRWKKHRWMLCNNRHDNAHLQHAWNKYGKESFEFIVLEVIEDPVERLAAEQVWLDIHHANKTCYNIAITAGPAGPMAEETKRKIGDAKRGKKYGPQSEEQRRASSERMIGKQYSLGYRHTPEALYKIAATSTGRRHTPASRQKMSDARKGMKFTEEHKRNISEARKGYKHTEEHKRNQSGATKRWWARRRAMGGLSLPVLIPNQSRPMLLWGSYRC